MAGIIYQKIATHGNNFGNKGRKNCNINLKKLRYGNNSAKKFQLAIIPQKYYKWNAIIKLNKYLKIQWEKAYHLIYSLVPQEKRKTTKCQFLHI